MAQRKSNRYQRRNKQVRSKKTLPQKPNLTGSTTYLCLTNEDAIYIGNLNRFKSHDFQSIIHKMVIDFNFLLHFEYNDFWNEIKTSLSFKYSLESCLQIFSRKKLNKHILRNEELSIDEIIQDQNYKIWRQLVRVVLFLYHRIICDSRQNQKQYIYDNWFFDVPKMLDLIDVYGHSSPQIVRQIINTALEGIPQYREDIQMFIDLLNDQVLSEVYKSLGFQYKAKMIKEAQNYNNAEVAFIQTFMKRMQTIYDCYDSLYKYIEFFPSYSKWLLITDFEIHRDLFDAYFLFLDRIKSWELNNTCLKPLMETIRQKCIKFLIKSFLELRDFMMKPIDYEIWIDGATTYYNLCKIFLQKIDTKKKQWEDLFKWIVDKSICQEIFIITPRMKEKFKDKNRHQWGKMEKEIDQTMKRCREFEKTVRDQINSQIQGEIGDPIFIIEGMPKLIDYQHFEESRNMDDPNVSRLSFDFKDQNLQVPQQRPGPQYTQKKRVPLNKGIDEYDDEPEQQALYTVVVGYENQQAAFIPEKGQNYIFYTKKRVNADTSMTILQDSEIYSKTIQEPEGMNLLDECYEDDASIQKQNQSMQYSPEQGQNQSLKRQSCTQQQINASMQMDNSNEDQPNSISYHDPDSASFVESSITKNQESSLMNNKEYWSDKSLLDQMQGAGKITLNQYSSLVNNQGPDLSLIDKSERRSFLKQQENQVEGSKENEHDLSIRILENGEQQEDENKQKNQLLKDLDL